jgi:hypothetical protein
MIEVDLMLAAVHTPRLETALRRMTTTLPNPAENTVIAKHFC